MLFKEVWLEDDVLIIATMLRVKSQSINHAYLTSPMVSALPASIP
jgi:hypothetical protein